MKTRQTILVVDDSKWIRQIIAARLKSLDVDLQFAEDGLQALEATRNDPPDLILLDVIMPDFNGFEVCRELKAEPRTHDIPVIFLTGADESMDKVHGFNLGAVDYVIKPFDPAELRARVRAALQTKALMDLLTSQTQLDGMTGLYNRRYFDQRLKQEIASAERTRGSLGLLLIDLDRFKRINDMYGHPDGDQVVRRFGVLLQETCRGEDVACRWGGDEFALILPGAGPEQALDAAQRLQHALHHDPSFAKLVGEPITVSIGGGFLRPGEPLDAGVLVHHADRALYASKRAGRNRVTLDQRPWSGAA